MPIARLAAGKPPPDHYYAANLLTVVHTVLGRYADLLEPRERHFGQRIVELSVPAQRLYARLIGRRGPLIREDSLAYTEVSHPADALSALVQAGLVERCPAAPPAQLCRLMTREELDSVFAPELARTRRTTKAERAALILAGTPAAFLRWRLHRAVAWIGLTDTDHLELYRLLFFGDQRQDFTTFVMRDLGVHRYEAVELCAETRLFPDRDSLQHYLDLVAIRDEVAALGKSPDIPRCADEVAGLLDRLHDAIDSRMLERRRSRILNHLGRNLERAGADQWALRCYMRSTLAPARERRMRILHRLGDAAGVERLRRAVLAAPESTLEADFATRFARRHTRESVPTDDIVIDARPDIGVEQRALDLLTADGGTGWHLENNLPMAVFGLAYWSWMFAPIEGAFLHPFQAGPTDLFWPDFFTARDATCNDPLDGPLKARLRRAACAKAGIANRLFNWRRCPRAVIEQVLDAVPEADLRALLEIVRGDLAGKRSGFPDLTIIYGPGEYEFVEVKGPNDRLQMHQHLWIEALRSRNLPVRVLRLRLGAD